MRAVNIYFLHRCRSLYSYVQSDLWPLDLSWDFQAVAPDAATLCSLFCFTITFILSSSSRLIHCPIITSQFMVGQMVMWHGGAVGFQVLAWLSSPILRLWPWCLSLSCGPSVSSSCSSSWVWTLRWGREHRTPCLHIFDLRRTNLLLFLRSSSSWAWRWWWRQSPICFPKCYAKPADGNCFYSFFASYVSFLSWSWSLRSEYICVYHLLSQRTQKNKINKNKKTLWHF